MNYKIFDFSADTQCSFRVKNLHNCAGHTKEKAEFLLKAATTGLIGMAISFGEALQEFERKAHGHPFTQSFYIDAGLTQLFINLVEEFNTEEQMEKSRDFYSFCLEALETAQEDLDSDRAKCCAFCGSIISKEDIFTKGSICYCRNCIKKGYV